MASGEIPLMVSSGRLVPFFVVGGADNCSVESVTLYDCCGNAVSGYGATIKSAMSVYSDGEKTTAFYSGQSALLNIPKGVYYLSVTLEDTESAYEETFISDLFQVCTEAELSGLYTVIKWYDSDDVELPEGGVIPYAHTNGYAYYGNKLYFDAEIGMPEYKFTEEGEDRDGRFFPVKQLSEKSYKFKVIATEQMCDCLRLICQSDVVTIRDKHGRTYNVEHAEMDITWLDGGALAEVDVTFETDTVVKKIGKNYGTITPR